MNGRPTPRSLDELLSDYKRRIIALERRLFTVPVATQGTTAERDALWGAPSTDAARVALANKQVRWFNTTKGYEERYYAVQGSAGLVVPGLDSTYGTAGWYRTSGDWASKTGPSSYFSPYQNVYATSAVAADSVMNNSVSTSGVRILLSGIYRVTAMQRGNGVNVPSGYIGIGQNGNRTTLESRTGGAWFHDHAASLNAYTTSMYLGPLNVGEWVTVGPPDATSAGYLSYSSSSFAGGFTVERVS